LYPLLIPIDPSGNKMNDPNQRLKIDLLVHDLKGPLAVVETGITALLNKVAQYGNLTEKQERVLKRVLRNTKTAQTLVSDTLALEQSKPGEMNLTQVSVSKLFTDVLVEVFDLANIGASKKIRAAENLLQLKNSLAEDSLVLDIEEDLWGGRLVLDGNKVKQILRNLLINAFKYKKNQITLEVKKKTEYMRFSVTDDGIGIPEDCHERIFECYFQLPSKDDFVLRGHGLGLAGVKILVEDMNGELLLESSTDKGARFIVHLPLMEE
jgi:two-component system, OmpR family, sensor kinase